MRASKGELGRTPRNRATIERTVFGARVLSTPQLGARWRVSRLRGASEAGVSRARFVRLVLFTDQGEVLNRCGFPPDAGCPRLAAVEGAEMMTIEGLGETLTPVQEAWVEVQVPGRPPNGGSFVPRTARLAQRRRRSWRRYGGRTTGLPWREVGLHPPGVYQIGLVQARSWMVAGTLSSNGSPLRTAS